MAIPIWIDNSATDSSNHLDRSYLWGWLIIHQSKIARKWQVREIKFLKRLITQLAIAIKQGLLYEQLEKSNKKLQQLALCDGLTQVYNRRYFDQQISLEWRRLRRLRSPLSVILCDVDYFKLYNDTYGHQAGDNCLRQVANVLSQAIKRPADFVARYGGEEFVIVLPHTPIEGAIEVAKSIQANLENLQLPHIKSSVSSVVTLSMGIATTIPDSEDFSTSSIRQASTLDCSDVYSLVKAADRALYLAKSSGRNCMIYSPQKNLVYQ